MPVSVKPSAYFRQNIIKFTSMIPYGKVTTYGTLASLAGSPRASRVIGGILHSSKKEIPWHRVINRYGYISIKCFDHPKSFQKGLLEGEGIEVSEDFMVDLDKYGWVGQDYNN